MTRAKTLEVTMPNDMRIILDTCSAYGMTFQLSPDMTYAHEGHVVWDAYLFDVEVPSAYDTPVYHGTGDTPAQAISACATYCQQQRG